jgi:DNA mismatch repair protein MutL
VDLPPDQCDVNVHPAKSEIKFARDRAVFDAVYFAVKNALGTLDRPAWSQPAAPAPREAVHATARPPPDAFSEMSAADFRLTLGGKTQAATQLHIPQTPASSTPDAPSRFAAYSELSGENDAPVREAVLAYRAEDRGQGTEDRAGEGSAGSAAPPMAWRYIGEALGGYLLAELPDGLALIDKHAAHERIIFNRLKAEWQRPMAQLLLSPLTVLLPAVEAQSLLARADWLAGMGFALEEFGGGALAVREAPADVDAEDIPALLGELAARLREGRRDPAPRLTDDLLHLVACKAAVKLGRASHPAEAQALVQQVLSDPELRHCPHGRPVCVVIPRRELEKQFRR